MSDDCERLFSSTKILLKDCRSRLQIDIIKANKCLCYLYRPPWKGLYNNEEVGVLEGEPDDQPRSFKEAVKARLAALKATNAAAELVDNKDNLQEEYAAIEADGDKVEVDKVDKVYPANQS